MLLITIPLVLLQTREGSLKALRKSDLVIEGSFVLVEATSLEDVPNKISIPNLIGDLEVPLLLVKNPTRTVMIKQLTHDISTYQLKEALAFCGSGISSFFLGSSSSVAYVEFEVFSHGSLFLIESLGITYQYKQ